MNIAEDINIGGPAFLKNILYGYQGIVILGPSTLTANTGTTEVPLTINNGTSTGAILVLQDNGTTLFSLADGGTYTVNGNWTGWTGANETWTYASASTFTVSGDVTAKYSKGTRLKWTQTTVKYGVVVLSSHSGGTTTVTILTNTDYTIANAAISANSYSYMVNPQAYPDYFALAAPTFDVNDIDDGAAGQPTTTRHVGKVTGKTFRAEFHGSGVKNGAGRTYAITAISSYPTPATGDTTRASLGTAYVLESTHGASAEIGQIVKGASAGTYVVAQAADTDVANNATIDSLTWKAEYEF